MMGSSSSFFSSSLLFLFFFCFVVFPSCSENPEDPEDIKQCEGTTIITEASGYFRDHSLENTTYDTGFPIACFWKIVPRKVDETGVITLIFDYLDLGVRDRNPDYVEIYDGVDAYGVSLGYFTGNKIPEPIVTSGKAAFVKFHTSGYEPAGLGFQLNFSAISCPNDCNSQGYCLNGACICDVGYSEADCSKTSCENDCGGDRGTCVKETVSESESCVCNPGFYGGDCTAPQCDGQSIFVASAGSFTDHHVGEGTELYEHNTFCQWLITPPPAKKGHVQYIRLHFDRFATEFEGDYVRVYDSYSQDANHSLGNFSGHVIPSDVISTTSVMLIVFETDVAEADEGFTAVYTVVQKKVETVTETHPGDDWAAAFVATVTFFVGIGAGIGGSMFYEGNFSIDFGGGSGGSGGGGGGSEEMFPQDTYSRLEVGGDDDEAPDVMELSDDDGGGDDGTENVELDSD